MRTEPPDGVDYNIWFMEDRKKWAERFQMSLDEVPWHVCFMSDRELTEAQKRKGAEIARERGWE